MTRVLFVVPPLVGHINPTVAVGLSLTRAGHEVVWVGHEGRVRPLLPPGAELIALDETVSEAAWASLRAKTGSVRGLLSLQILWEDVLVPLAHSMLPGVADAIATWKPDVVVADQQALAGALSARRAGIPWATSCTTSAGIVNPLEGLPKVAEWVASQLRSLEDAAGLPHVIPPDLSPHLVVVFSSRAFVGNGEFPPHYLFVGPSVESRPDDTPFPWDALDPSKRRVFLSLGTVSNDRGEAFYAVAKEALGSLDIQVIVAAQEDLVPNPPPNFIVRARVPQLALLSHVHAVITHGGHNTVVESLANGLPLVVAPIRDDQPVIANQVEAARAGIRIKFGRTSPETLRAAVLRALDDVTLRDGARAIAASFREAGGAHGAAEAILRLDPTQDTSRSHEHVTLSPDPSKRLS